MEIDGDYETDYWRHVILEWESDNGRVRNRTIHTHKAELEELSDDILGKLHTLKNNPTGFHDDPDFSQSDLQGYPDETMLPRDYTHKVVALFSLSCGIMEQQLGILLTVDLIPSSRRSTYVNDKLDSMSLGRKLEFARDTDVIGNGLFSEAWDVRKARNKLVHNPVFRFSIGDYNIHKNRIKKATRAPNKLDRRIQAEI